MYEVPEEYGHLSYNAVQFRRSRRFGGTHCLDLQGRRVRQAIKPVVSAYIRPDLDAVSSVGLCWFLGWLSIRP
jgi:hypothetical protein